MGRKRTLKFHKGQEPKMKVFEIGIQNNEEIKAYRIAATRVDSDLETLKIYIGDNLIGEFKEWMFYIESLEANTLPKDFGKVV